jgi:YHS domain-containing protein
MRRGNGFIVIAASLTALAILSGLLGGCSDRTSTAPEDRDAAASPHHQGSHDHPDHSGHEHPPPAQDGPARHDGRQDAKAEVAEGIAQKTCPVMGDPIDPEVFIEHEGRRIYFCCDFCIDKFKEAPADYLSKLDSID